jgi:hypothetical protein
LATLHPCSIELDICVEILHGEAEEWNGNRVSWV